MTAERMRKQIPQIRTDFVQLIHKKISNKKVYGREKNDVELHISNVFAAFSCVFENKGNVLFSIMHNPMLRFLALTEKTG